MVLCVCLCVAWIHFGILTFSNKAEKPGWSHHSLFPFPFLCLPHVPIYFQFVSGVKQQCYCVIVCFSIWINQYVAVLYIGCLCLLQNCLILLFSSPSFGVIIMDLIQGSAQPRVGSHEAMRNVHWYRCCPTTFNYNLHP